MYMNSEMSQENDCVKLILIASFLWTAVFMWNSAEKNGETCL